MQVADVGNGLVSDGTRAYDLQTLFQVVAQNPVHRLPLAKFRKFLHQRRYRIGNQNVSLYTVCLHRAKYADEFARVQRADTRYPVLLAEVDDGGPLYVIDGLHRVAKLAFLRQQKTVPVRYVSLAQMQRAVF